jgi:BirA family transcriptional regulator, biotin operon repressor / biotin---[acetyl-CoA-carboxylase] ligase
MATPLHTVHLGTVTSTMTEARARFEGTPVLVTAGLQTQGRGRSGRRWVHADRAVAASLAFEVDWPPERHPLIPLLAGLSAAGVFGTDLKWPNDLVTASGKVGGILVESDGDAVVVGLGVNLWWPHPVEGAAALHPSDPGPEAAVAHAGAWAAALVAALAAGYDEWDRPGYEARCATVGKEITWEPEGSGRARGVDERGRLIVETAGGVAFLDSGEVTHVREAGGG